MGGKGSCTALLLCKLLRREKLFRLQRWAIWRVSFLGAGTAQAVQCSAALSSSTVFEEANFGRVKHLLSGVFRKFPAGKPFAPLNSLPNMGSEVGDSLRAECCIALQPKQRRICRFSGSLTPRSLICRPANIPSSSSDGLQNGLMASDKRVNTCSSSSASNDCNPHTCLLTNASQKVQLERVSRLSLDVWRPICSQT